MRCRSPCLSMNAQGKAMRLSPAWISAYHRRGFPCEIFQADTRGLGDRGNTSAPLAPAHLYSFTRRPWLPSRSTPSFRQPLLEREWTQQERELPCLLGRLSTRPAGSWRQSVCPIRRRAQTLSSGMNPVRVESGKTPGSAGMRGATPQPCIRVPRPRGRGGKRVSYFSLAQSVTSVLPAGARLPHVVACVPGIHAVHCTPNVLSGQIPDPRISVFSDDRVHILGSPVPGPECREPASSEGDAAPSTRCLWRDPQRRPQQGWYSREQRIARRCCETPLLDAPFLCRWALCTPVACVQKSHPYRDISADVPCRHQRCLPAMLHAYLTGHMLHPPGFLFLLSAHAPTGWSRVRAPVSPDVRRFARERTGYPGIRWCACNPQSRSHGGFLPIHSCSSFTLSR